jgi:translation elongation factor EF-Tu-like GTPase
MFRKLLDQGEAGDNVGLLLRGVDREGVERQGAARGRVCTGAEGRAGGQLGQHGKGPSGPF